MSVARRRELIGPEHPHLPVVQQCELISISRSAFSYTAVGENSLNLTLMRLIDEQFMDTPFYDTRQMARQRLAAVYPTPRVSGPHSEHTVFPYLCAI
jgi:putative transposase